MAVIAGEAQQSVLSKFCRLLFNEIIKIRLKSIYGIRKKELSEKYSKIVDVLYDNFFYDLSGSYLNKFTAIYPWSVSHRPNVPVGETPTGE